ncbi:hypothetical protein ACYZT3_00625 [Pseudomonas sp. MDT1-16]|uniref:hypothetical protein n=1 Tax=Pseudomonas sp. AL03 TaxID=3042230 RepID=UPI00249C8BEB|nr:hypothetical protein [Pseudomonas sp. AL03]MDI3272016.1 hypothetical protein [Pseudomonas sp. AL03]
MSTLTRFTLFLIIFLTTQMGHATTVLNDTPWPPTHSKASVTFKGFSTTSIEKKPIFVFAFIHDDIPESAIDSIFQRYLLDWVKEITAISGRRVSMEFIRNRPPYTNYSYQAASETSYRGWETLARNYRDDQNLPHNRTTKFLLLTNSAMINNEVLGVASPGQQFGIASLIGKQIVGHELGHMFTANHELSDVQYNGWWCETFMRDVTPGLSNCYRYSDGNRELIKSFLGDVP